MLVKALLAVIAAVCSVGCARADVLLAGITEARGGGTAAGTAFRNGYQLAIDEINAAGGLLGQPVRLRQFDIDTRDEDAQLAAKQAVQERPFAILGPVFSGMTVSAMQHTVNAGIPHFTGGEAVSLARKFHPSLLRTSLTQQGAVPRLTALATYGLGARRLAILWIDNEYGRSGRQVFLESANRRGAAIAFEEGIKPGQKDFGEVVQRLKTQAVDAVVLYLNEGETIDALRALKAAAYDRPVLGEGPMLTAKVIEGAGEAAEGVIGHTGITVESSQAHMAHFVSRYTARYGSLPDHNAVKGYFAVQVVRVGVEAVGRVDRQAFLEFVKNTRLDGRRYPRLMTTATYDLFGDLNRESYFVQVRGGRGRVLATLSSIDSPFLELANGRTLPLNSNEFRAELQAMLARGTVAAAAPKP